MNQSVGNQLSKQSQLQDECPKSEAAALSETTPRLISRSLKESHRCPDKDNIALYGCDLAWACSAYGAFLGLYSCVIYRPSSVFARCDVFLRGDCRPRRTSRRREFKLAIVCKGANVLSN